MFLAKDLRAAPAHADLRRQADLCRALGSPFIAQVLEAAERSLALAPRTAALMSEWPGDPAAAALALRLNAALHALARAGVLPGLSALYARAHDDFDGAIAPAMAEQDDVIAEWMRHPTQTNEVGRAAPLYATLMLLAAQYDTAFELLELGASCGLNLNMGLYAYRLGDVMSGDAHSPLLLAPEWRGAAAPVGVPVAIQSARGADLRPLDPLDSAMRQRLVAYVWADQTHRIARLEQALALAQRHPPRVERASAAPWLAERLDEAQAPGTCRVVMHSMVLQYLNAQDRLSVVEQLNQAGARATRTRPLAAIGFEWTQDRRQVQLRLTTWPGGATRVLATCHPYGDWVAWRA